MRSRRSFEVLALADRLGNVAEASRLSGVSRDTIYRHRKLIKQGGIESLKRQETPDLHHKNRTERAIEEVVIEFSLANPHLGQSKVSRLLKSERKRRHTRKRRSQYMAEGKHEYHCVTVGKACRIAATLIV